METIYRLEGKISITAESGGNPREANEEINQVMGKLQRPLNGTKMQLGTMNEIDARHLGIGLCSHTNGLEREEEKRVIIGIKFVK